MLFFPLINAKMPTIVGILTFMSRKNFMPVLGTYANSADPVQMPHLNAMDQFQHCLLTGLCNKCENIHQKALKLAMESS